MEKVLKDGSVVLIREALPNDAEVVLEYMKKVNEETKNLTREPDEFKMTVEQEEQFLLRNKESEDNCMLLLFKDAELICTAGIHGSSLRRLKHKVGMGISVLLEYHNLGVGSVMMEALIEKAKEYGKKKIELEVRIDNPSAIHLYEKYGFKIEGEREMGFFVDNKYVNLIEMGLDLR